MFYRSPLHFAAERGNLDLVKFILTKKGVDLNETTNTVLNHFLLLEFLIIYFHLSALHYAAGHQKTDVVNFLLEQKGINAAVKDVSGLGARGVEFENGKYVYKPINLKQKAIIDE